MQQNETKEIHPDEGENGDYLFSEINNPDFEETIGSIITELMATHSDDQELVEKAVSTESVSEARRRGLVPQSGDWGKPKRWIRPEDADVPVDTGEKPRKKASEDVPISNLTIDAMKAVFSDDFSMSDFQEMYSSGLDGYTTNIVELRGRPKGITPQAVTERTDRSNVTIEVEILDDDEDYTDDEEYEKQPKGIDGYTPDSRFHVTAVGTMSRTFTRDKDGILSVRHNRFVIAQRFQGKGISSDIAENVEKHYEKLGVGTITLNANAKIGGYAWARQGYDFEGPRSRNTIEEHFITRIGYFLELGNIDKKTHAEYVNEVKSFEHSWEFATWNPSHREKDSEHLGKTWMLGQTWDAEKTLDKKSPGYQIGKAYFAAKRNEKNTS